MRIRTSPDAGGLPSPMPLGGRAASTTVRGRLGRGGTIRRPSSTLAALVAWVASTASRFEERRHLADMENRMLRDIGITPFERSQETRKRWWQR